MFWNRADALELIELTYTLVDEEDGCLNLFERLGELFGDAMFCLQMWDDSIAVDSDRMILTGWDANAIAAYVEYYSTRNPYLEKIGQLRSGDVRQLNDIIPAEVSSKSEFLNDFQHVNGNYEGVTATILREEKRYGAISIDGPRHTQQHWNELEALINVLAPHLRRVMHLSRQLQDVPLYQSIANQSMDRIAASMIVVDANRKVIFTNSSASAMLSEFGVLRTGAGGSLMASTLDQTRELNNLISSASRDDHIGAGSSGGFMMLRSREGKQVAVMVSPLHRGLQKRMGLAETWSSQKKYAVIFMADPESAIRLPTELLILQYGLTKTEAELALHLHSGGTLSSYCDMKFVTMNTARSQLKSIFRKTGVVHQGGLVALLNRMTVLGERTTPD